LKQRAAYGIVLCREFSRVPFRSPKAPAVQCLGGWFVDLGHPDDGAAT